MRVPPDPSLTIRRMVKAHPPRLPYTEIKEEILGSAYDLSLVFVGAQRSRSLNHRFRKKNAPANVLAFPLSPKSGEIVICLEKARRDAPDFAMSYRTFVGYLFIHGILHLKGFRHGRTMDREEKLLLKQFSLV